MTTGVITINGRKLDFHNGQTILEAARAHGLNIPTLCKYDKGDALGACGICVVECRRTGDLMRACSTAAEAEMDILTDSHRVVEARKEALTRLVNSGTHNCFVMSLSPSEWTEYQMKTMSQPWHDVICPSWGHCELQDLVVKYGLNTDALTPSDIDHPLDDQHPMFVRDYNRCIRCGRCIQACNDIQVNNAIPMPEDWTVGEPPPLNSFPLVDYERCVHCGECVQACPVGALFEKKAFKLSNGNDVQKIRTTCPYCGVGCQLQLHVKDGKIIRVTGVEEGSPNKGRLCVKGRFGYDFIYSEERLKTPLIKENGEFREASWDEALDYTADRLKAIIREHGPDSVAGVSCARSINEDSYQMQKFFRAVLGTNNIDHCART